MDTGTSKAWEQIYTNIDYDKEIVTERVNSYVFLGLKLMMGPNFIEIKRENGLGRAAFGKLRLIFQSLVNKRMTRKVLESCVLPVLREFRL